MTATLEAPAGIIDPHPGNRLRPRWERPALAALLLGTALLYLWQLGASGYANSFYASAVQAGAQSWKAMLFGSLDAGNAITVDKPAMFLWPMELAGRVFGFNSWSMLVPQALEGVAAVALLYAAVKRISGPLYGLAAGAVLALTPVAVLMFRFNNPDAMLALLLTGAAYAVVRALEKASGRWLALAGALVGLGFITKMGQALLVVPAMGLTYLIAAPTGLGRRIRQLLVAGVAMVLGAGWWIALVELWPAGSRPYIGGSTNNSILELAFGYNGLGRLFGNTAGNGGGGPGGGAGGGLGGNGGFGGATGWGRLFRSDMATEISWLLPTALLALVMGLYLTARAPRTDRHRAGLILFGGSLVTTTLTFSFMKGVIHPYYTIALAPLIGAVVAITSRLLWDRRDQIQARVLAVVLLETTVVWDLHLLGSWQPTVRVFILLASVVAVVGLLFGEWFRRAVAISLVAATLAVLGGSAAYAVSTASHPHTGSIPASGPSVSSLGGAGATMNTALTDLLKATSTRWAAATTGSMSAAPLQLASGRPVIAIGGFNGGDNAPTLAQFQAYVANHDVSYYVSGNGGGPGGGQAGAGSSIATWVAAHYTATTVGSATVYDLTQPAS